METALCLQEPYIDAAYSDLNGTGAYFIERRNI